MRHNILRIAAALLLGVSAILALAQPAGAQATGPCTVIVDGQRLEAAESPQLAIPVAADAVVAVLGQSLVPVTRADISVSVWPLSWTVTEESGAAIDHWGGSLSVAEYARFGSGLYEITATTDVCSVHGWVNVTGQSPLETVAGLVSLGIIAIGVITALGAILTGGRSHGVLAVVGGVVTGIGLLLFAQQAGITGITPTSAILWTAVPGAISGVLNQVVGGLSQAASGAAPATAGPATGGAATAQPPPSPPPAPQPEPPAPPIGAGGATIGAGGAAIGVGAGSIRDEPDPPRTTYARLSCPDAVVVEQPFGLIVGLADRPDPHVVGEAMRRPPSSVGPYKMTVQLVADGLRLADPRASWRIDLPVTADEPYPFVTIQLVPDTQAAPVAATSIRAMYSIDGNPIGSVALVRSAELLASAPAQPLAQGVDLALPSGHVAPDLTVRIERAESEASGALLVQLLAADPTIDMPDAPIRIDIGGDPAADLRRIVNEMQEVEGRPTQYVALRGIGLTVAEQLPIEFWDALSRVAERVGDRPPTILFLSAEPYVPWELAVVDPPLDPALPPFLAAQATVGRWVLGQRRPVLPPPMNLSVHGVAAVSGVYALPGWQRLADAEAEAADIVRVYKATPVDATIGGILDLLQGRPVADVIHFAVHGTYDAEEAKDGLILVDGSALDPLAVRGIALRGHPFVFLNACQVGRGDQILGDHAGLAAAFLFAGASGVIAPLWSIDDKLARDIAVRFYERAMRGEPPAEVMRTERVAFRDAPETTSSTYMAYQFFGHPGLRLEADAG
jgi:hypothetical protein